MKTETIAAIASAMTNSGIGIIRISGEDIPATKRKQAIITVQESYDSLWPYL